MPQKKSKANNGGDTPEIIYPEPRAEIYRVDGIGPVTVDMAKKLLGWTVVTDGPFHLIDAENQKVWLRNNVHNRRFNPRRSMMYEQEILNRRYKFNMESLVIDHHGHINSAVHRLVGLVRAGQRWGGDQRSYWLQKWPVEPYIESVVCFGASDDADVLRTYDNVLPRSLEDIFYTQSELFERKVFSEVDLVKLTHMLKWCIRVLWVRLRIDRNAYVSIQTPSESLEFLDRHPRVVKCVRHVWEEDKDKLVSRWLNPGHASALLYLMSAHDSDPDRYYGRGPGRKDGFTEEYSESRGFKWSHHEQACEFWRLLCSNDPSFDPIRKARRPTEGDDRRATGKVFTADGRDAGTTDEKMGTLVKAWLKFVAGEKFMEPELHLHYETKRNENGLVISADLDEWPSMPGIDRGPWKGDEEGDSDTIEERKAAVDEERANGNGDHNDADRKLAQHRMTERAARKGTGAAVVSGGEDGAPSNVGKAGDADGKPPTPRLKKPARSPRAEVEASQTEAARKADAELAASQQ
jgi:hypothetical protein